MNKEIERILMHLSTLEPESSEYSDVLNKLTTLVEANTKKPWYAISREEYLKSATYLLGIILVLQFERVNVLTSKASLLWRR